MTRAMWGGYVDAGSLQVQCTSSAPEIAWFGALYLLPRPSEAP